MAFLHIQVVIINLQNTQIIKQLRSVSKCFRLFYLKINNDFSIGMDVSNKLAKLNKFLREFKDIYLTTTCTWF